uniref:Uncharacterized protein n=1 Tax=Ascaris lumbricoides TaxID=6252 RepID=A0A0M3HQS9_ASCLU
MTTYLMGAIISCTICREANVVNQTHTSPYKAADLR